MKLTVTVPGLPVPQGSMKSLGPRRLVHSNGEKLLPWRDSIAWHTRQEMAEDANAFPLDCPISVTATFSLPRPASAVRARWSPDRKPDLDKLLRSLLDAITASGLWVDDARVVDVRMAKVYGLPGVTFTVSEAVRGEQVTA